MPADEARQRHESIAERELFDGPAIQDTPDVLQHLVHLLQLLQLLDITPRPLALTKNERLEDEGSEDSASSPADGGEGDELGGGRRDYSIDWHVTVVLDGSFEERGNVQQPGEKKRVSERGSVVCGKS